MPIRQYTRDFIFLLPIMRIRVKNLLFIFLSLVLFTSCGDFEKIKKSSDVNAKLTMANKYYDSKQYQKANELYGDLLGIMKNTRNYEPLYLKYAYSFYYMKDYLEASFHFKNFVEFFPNSKDADECEFMHAVSLYKYAPKYSLDQTNTIKALEALQSYINTHPNSKRITEANGYVDNSRLKLETKEADAARLYFNISQYKAASIAYKSVLRNYPESPNSDLYQFMVLRALYKYARASIPEKQEERYANAISAYNDLKTTYPHSTFLGDAEKVYSQADLNVKKLRDKNEHK
jgi:outer membrane protein assembly factor BamD